MNMSCEKIQNLLCEYLDKELNDIETKYVEKHLGECFNCLKEFEALKKTTQVVGAMPDVSVPKDFRSGLSARLDNRKASVFEIFTKQRVWLPTLSLALAAMLLIIVFNKEFGFLNMKTAGRNVMMFKKTQPQSDTGQNNALVLKKIKSELKNTKMLHSSGEQLPYQFYKQGYSITPLTKEREEKQEVVSTPKIFTKAKEKPALKPGENKTPEIPEEIKSSDKGRKKLKETAPAKSEQEKTTKDTEAMPETTVSTPAPAITMDDTKNEEPDEDSADEVKEKNLAKKMLSEEKSPAEPTIALGEKADVAKEGYAPADGKQKNLLSPGSPAFAKNTAPSLNGVSATTGTSIAGGTITTDKGTELPVLRIDVFASDPGHAVEAIKSIVKSYHVVHSFYRTVTLTAPQNKIGFLLGKLKSEGSVEVKSKYDPESTLSIQINISVKQKEEK